MPVGSCLSHQETPDHQVPSRNKNTRITNSPTNLKKNLWISLVIAQPQMITCTALSVKFIFEHKVRYDMQSMHDM